jgi:hypothetical protein
MGIALDSQGRLLVADFENKRVRCVTMDGATTALAGNLFHEDGPAAAALRFSVSDIAAPDGPIFVAEDNYRPSSPACDDYDRYRPMPSS